MKTCTQIENVFIYNYYNLSSKYANGITKTKITPIMNSLSLCALQFHNTKDEIL